VAGDCVWSNYFAMSSVGMRKIIQPYFLFIKSFIQKTPNEGASKGAFINTDS